MTLCAVHQRGFSISAWDKDDVTVRPEINYNYLCGDGMQPVYRLVYKPSVTV